MLGDPKFEISDMETKLMHELQTLITNNSSTLLKIIEYSAELDCLIRKVVKSKHDSYFLIIKLLL